jgi:hypothetical protein
MPNSVIWIFLPYALYEYRKNKSLHSWTVLAYASNKIFKIGLKISMIQNL